MILKIFLFDFITIDSQIAVDYCTVRILILARRIRKTIGLSDIRWRTQTIRLSNIELNRTVGCQALLVIVCLSKSRMVRVFVGRNVTRRERLCLTVTRTKRRVDWNVKTSTVRKWSLAKRISILYSYMYISTQFIITYHQVSDFVEPQYTALACRKR
jgi:hypothetical protein